MSFGYISGIARVGAMAVAAILLAVIACMPQTLGGGSSLAGQKAADFTLRQVGGGEVSLSDFKGKVVVLNFWASW